MSDASSPNSANIATDVPTAIVRDGAVITQGASNEASTQARAVSSLVHQNNPAYQEDDDEISLLDLLAIIAENLRFLIFLPLGIGVLTYLGSFLLPISYKAKTTFLQPQQQQSSTAAMLSSLGGLGAFGGAAVGLKNPADQYIAIAKSNLVADNLIERMRLQTRYDADSVQDTRLVLRAKLQVSAGKDGLITIEAEDEDAQFAAELANATVDEFKVSLKTLVLSEAQVRRRFFEPLLHKAKINMEVAEEAVRRSGIRSDILKSSPAAAVSEVAKLEAGITAQELKIASMRGYLSDTAPELRQAMIELTAMQTQKEKVGRDEQLQPASENYLAAYRDFKYQETLVDMYTRQFELARVDETREGAVIQVLDVAEPPVQRSSPKRMMITLVATLAAGFMALLFVFIRSAWSGAQNNPAQQEKIDIIAGHFKTAFLGKPRRAVHALGAVSAEKGAKATKPIARPRKDQEL